VAKIANIPTRRQWSVALHLRRISQIAFPRLAVASHRRLPSAVRPQLQLPRPCLKLGLRRIGLVMHQLARVWWHHQLQDPLGNTSLGHLSPRRVSSLGLQHGRRKGQAHVP